MVRKILRFRVARYACVVVAAVAFNFVVFNFVLSLGTSVYLTNVIAFVAGGQLSFILHDIHTYGDKHPTMKGWGRRWILFIGGNFSSLGINSLAITLILALHTPERIAHLLALTISGTYSVLWNHYVSHKDPPQSDPLAGVEH